MLASKVMLEPGQLLIDGQWVDGAKKFDTINPATGEVLTQIAEGSSADVDHAVAAARRALEDRNGSWRKMSASERGRLIWKLADLLEKNIDEFAELETLGELTKIARHRFRLFAESLPGRHGQGGNIPGRTASRDFSRQRKRSGLG